ncbi:carbon storage regulator, CsrA [Ferrithrix thermotolerans DSM 19514]|uniref:Carbon storage regulator, CsrA n=1 Tax=Ferrithrix thermotolerans DSM 19514 TaxID=1121881 RepID=A0A1M4TZY6_9ACTN|nr:carbon storage regulator [Ferrithrix thermotolerans]SHE49990.1 carbon storage regulator, CsrA [Ferrithrix thermotolerans DSM 19514]
MDVHRDQVRIGIEAPREVDVHRQEVFKALEKANQEAAIEMSELETDAPNREDNGR